MAYVAAVVGAGGKTGYIRKRAEENASLHKRTAIMTTTHIMEEPSEWLIDYIGTPCETDAFGRNKLTWPGEKVYREVYAAYDEVLIEADGAKHHPLKIPADYEPVIPEDVNEIVIVMSGFAIGRDFHEVCFRSALADAQIREAVRKKPAVNRALIDLIAEKYYRKPLAERYPLAEIRYVFHHEAVRKPEDVRILAVLLASGESRRFGEENKLLAMFHGKPLYRWQFDALREAKRTCTGMRIDLAAVSCCDRILAETGAAGDAVPIRNEEFREGIAASIRLGAAYARRHGYDAAAFFAADQPAFGAADVQGLLEQFVLSGRKMACAFSSHPANPAVFDRAMFGKLTELKGDTGAIRLIRSDPGKVHYYIVNENKLRDVDTPEDLEW